MADGQTPRERMLGRQANDAGCRYCGYSDVRDVRPHRHRDVIDRIDAAGGDAYVPLAARDGDIADALEIE